MLFVTELLQSLGNGHANERRPRRNRSQQPKIDKTLMLDRLANAKPSSHHSAPFAADTTVTTPLRNAGLCG